MRGSHVTAKGPPPLPLSGPLSDPYQRGKRPHHHEGIVYGRWFYHCIFLSWGNEALKSRHIKTMRGCFRIETCPRDRSGPEDRALSSPYQPLSAPIHNPITPICTPITPISNPISPILPHLQPYHATSPYPPHPPYPHPYPTLSQSAVCTVDYADIAYGVLIGTKYSLGFGDSPGFRCSVDATAARNTNAFGMIVRRMRSSGRG